MSETTEETIVLSEQEKAELTEFVATQMFSNLQFNQVLATIEHQCRTQATEVIQEADTETLTKIQEDLANIRADNQVLAGAAVQDGAETIPGL